MGYPVHYFQDGEGACAGPPPAPEAPAPEAPAPAGEAAVEAVEEVVAEEEEDQLPLAMRSFSGWVGGLDSDAWSAAAFAAALVAGACAASLAQLCRPGTPATRLRSLPCTVMGAAASCCTPCRWQCMWLNPMALPMVARSGTCSGWEWRHGLDLHVRCVWGLQELPAQEGCLTGAAIYFYCTSASGRFAETSPRILRQSGLAHACTSVRCGTVIASIKLCFSTANTQALTKSTLPMVLPD